MARMTEGSDQAGIADCRLRNGRVKLLILISAQGPGGPLLPFPGRLRGTRRRRALFLSNRKDSRRGKWLELGQGARCSGGHWVMPTETFPALFWRFPLLGSDDGVGVARNPFHCQSFSGVPPNLIQELAAHRSCIWEIRAVPLAFQRLPTHQVSDGERSTVRDGCKL